MEKQHITHIEGHMHEVEAEFIVLVEPSAAATQLRETNRRRKVFENYSKDITTSLRNVVVARGMSARNAGGPMARQSHVLKIVGESGVAKRI